VVEACLADGDVGKRRLTSEFSAWCLPLPNPRRAAHPMSAPATWVLSDKASKLKDRAAQKSEDMRGGPVTK
jgi:hypothetical protein